LQLQIGFALQRRRAEQVRQTAGFQRAQVLAENAGVDIGNDGSTAPRELLNRRDFFFRKRRRTEEAEYFVTVQRAVFGHFSGDEIEVQTVAVAEVHERRRRIGRLEKTVVHEAGAVAGVTPENGDAVLFQ